ncbi:hypothetical protein E1292_46525 [Nonomuraea deserti]|uniref:Uncharacterized protein n=1 Tax=Nonomuraea deserti TaxID=1848322 RepID=A0A4R4U8G1_9ACTN|nr:hypothetical protein [Nonomuraea deserti]TDC87581.1 hypothetical protein E1292_46525 [Nonomuraea deserti]
MRLLLDCCQAGHADRAECLRLVFEGRATPYWEPFQRALIEPVEYVTLETEAPEVRYWHMLPHATAALDMLIDQAGTQAAARYVNAARAVWRDSANPAEHAMTAEDDAIYRDEREARA